MSTEEHKTLQDTRPQDSTPTVWTPSNLLEAEQILQNAGKIPEINKSAKIDDFFKIIFNIREGTAKLDEITKEKILAVLSAIDKSPPDLQQWIKLESRDLFTWSDYSKAYFRMITKHNDEKKDEAKIYTEICYAYYYFNDLETQETFDKFLMHPPYDYTRPHGWYAEEHYYSFGEAIAALIAKKKNQDNKNPSSEDEILYHFQQRHKEFLQAVPNKIEDLIIPWSYYSSCHADARDPHKIRPHSIEVCAYYVFQNNLPIEYILKEPAPQPAPEDFPLISTDFLWYYCPSFKYFDAFTLTRFVFIWDLWLQIYQDQSNHWRQQDFEGYCKDHIFTQWPELKKPILNTFAFYWKGIKPKNDLLSFHDSFSHTLKFFGDMFNAMSFALLIQSQLTLVSDVQPNNLNSEEALIQKSLFQIMLKKYNDVLAWIKKQDLKSPKKQAVWSKDSAAIYHFLEQIPCTEELSKFQRKYANKEVEIEYKSFLLFEIKKYARLYLWKTDLRYLDKSPLTYAICGIKGIDKRLKPEKGDFIMLPHLVNKRNSKSPATSDYATWLHSIIKQDTSLGHVDNDSFIHIECSQNFIR